MEPKKSYPKRSHTSVNKGKRGPDAPNWKGGMHRDTDGRIRVWDPDAKRYFHRAVKVWMAAHPGEIVERGYVIHHLDGSKDNDVPENLVKMSLSAHVARHRRDLHGYIKVLQGIIEESGGTYPPLHDE
jgi:HNH endonuclease